MNQHTGGVVVPQDLRDNSQFQGSGMWDTVHLRGTK